MKVQFSAFVFLILAIVTVRASQATTPVSPTPAAKSAATSTPAPTEPAPTATLGNTRFTSRVQSQTCENSTTVCSIDTLIVATAIDNGDLIWERRIYFQTPITAAGESAGVSASPSPIPVTSLKLVGKKTVRAKNARGDLFDLDVKYGHMKKPKEARKYEVAKP